MLTVGNIGSWRHPRESKRLQKQIHAGYPTNVYTIRAKAPQNAHPRIKCSVLLIPPTPRKLSSRLFLFWRLHAIWCPEPGHTYNLDGEAQRTPATVTLHLGL